ncbi:hypothetical protein F4808DRAFT_365625 [Astrocystis sublimbata]|nr:hypothetical protein F4808DRAFT_365625 [Astrocystis sublimbata]
MESQFQNSAVWPAITHNLDFAMQEYLSLQDQHEELCQRLHALSPTSSTSTRSSASTAVTSPSVSPTRSFRDGPSPSRLAAPYPFPSSTKAGHGQNEQVAVGEQKLYDVNEGMKRALTELLNCEAVRQDRAMRTWVQTRLLETEKELRRGRRRRSSATVE